MEAFLFGGMWKAAEKQHERSETGNCLRWCKGGLEEQKNSKKGATIGEANHQTGGQRLRVEQDVGVEVLVRGSLLAGERADAQRHGRIQPEKAEGCMEWTSP